MSKTAKTIMAFLLIAAVTIGFSGCSLRNYGGMKYTVKDGGAVIRTYKNKSTVTVLEIPDEIGGKPVVKVENYGVFNAPSLVTIKIGKNVREIGTWAFTNNSALKEYIVDPGNEYFTAADGVLFSKDMQTLLFFPPKKGITVDKDGKVTQREAYTVPEGVRTIRSKAFYKCENLESVTLPSSLLTIEEKAFHRMSSLKVVVLPGSLQSIGKDAFAFCSSLTEITIPASVSRIGDYAFYSCPALKKVTMLCAKEKVELGDRWYPTNTGMDMNDLEIIWAGDGV